MNDQPPVEKKPGPSRKAIIGWGAGMLLVLGLAWFVGAVVWPVWRTREVVFAYTSGVMSAEAAIRQLGGPEQAPDRIAQYLHMPEWVREDHARAMTSEKATHAMYLLTLCGRPAVPVLIRALRHPDFTIRERSAFGLMQIGPDAADAVPSLVAALDDRNEQVRFNAATALGFLGPAAAEAIPRLQTMQKTDKSWAREAAADALKRIKATQEKRK